VVGGRINDPPGRRQVGVDTVYLLEVSRKVVDPERLEALRAQLLLLLERARPGPRLLGGVAVELGGTVVGLAVAGHAGAGEVQHTAHGARLLLVVVGALVYAERHLT